MVPNLAHQMHTKLGGLVAHRPSGTQPQTRHISLLSLPDALAAFSCVGRETIEIRAPAWRNRHRIRIRVSDRQDYFGSRPCAMASRMPFRKLIDSDAQ